MNQKERSLTIFEIRAILERTKFILIEFQMQLLKTPPNRFKGNSRKRLQQLCTNCTHELKTKPISPYYTFIFHKIDVL